MEASNHKPITGLSLALISAMLWGVLPVALKELLVAMDAVTIVWYRFFAAFAVLFLWLLSRRQLPDLRNISGSTRWILFIASTMLCINYFMFNYSLNFVNGETSEAVIQLSTLFLILGGVVFYKEPFSKIQLGGTLMIVIGLLLFFDDRLSALSNLDNRETLGVIIVIIAAITWAVYALLQKKLSQNFSSVQILLVIYVFSSLVLLPFSSPGELFDLNQAQFFILLFCCINTLIAYGCFAESLNHWHASKVSAVLALAPVFTIGTLKLVVLINPNYEFSDRLGWVSIAGAALLILGSIITALTPLLTGREKAVRA